MRIQLKTQQLLAPTKSFWEGIELLITNSHLINRRLIGSTYLYQAQLTLTSDGDILQLANDIDKLNLTIEDSNLFGVAIKKINYVIDIAQIQHQAICDCNSGTFVFILQLLPKMNLQLHLQQIIIFDKTNDLVVYIPTRNDVMFKLVPPFIYGWQYCNSVLTLWTIEQESSHTKAAKWLCEKVFPKLAKWIEEAETFDTPVSKSLSLVCVNAYSTLYHELKQKYAAQIIQIWPENTDPLKFVYEDVAIATYLILLWRSDHSSHSDKKPSFVDLGCGNGLLVHILNQEGFQGEGIDIRSRKIWSLYPETTNLQVKPITPSDDCLFPNADWIIGNHSDELTPWIPVIAARSSRNCRFFVLPCCAYEFDGKKYQRIDSSRSQYSEYLDYVQEISEICGFVTSKDKLRIPSTKRICLVGRERMPSHDVHQIEKFINKRCDLITLKSGGSWIKDYNVRASVELVRNCTKVDRKLVNEVVKSVANKLLATENFITSEFGSNWNAGGKLTIAEVVATIHSDKLKMLKKECGGIQTLLKNHHYIFQVVQGEIKFRVPQILTEHSKNAKKTQCWFQINHPQSCPLDEVNCRYSHV